MRDSNVYHSEMKWLLRVVLVAALCLNAVSPQSSPSSTAVTFGMRRLAFSTNQFGIDLYRALEAREGENVALCPFCVGASLAMLLLGTDEGAPSASALRQALYLWGGPSSEVHLAYRDLIAHFGLNLAPNEAEVDEGTPDLRLIHHLSVQRHFAVHYPYQFMLARYYNTSIHHLDFVLEAEQSVRSINAYFSRRTLGKAPPMLTRTPSPSTNLLLLSALYFRGSLDMDMGTTSARREGEGRGDHAAPPFTLMRAQRARVRYGTHEYLNCTAVEVPFRGGLISLLTLLPRDPEGMALLETRLSAQRLADILNAMRVDTIHFQMPRIVVGRTQGRNLTRALYQLGLTDLFTPGHAHLFGVSPFGWLHLTDVAHATYVEATESGDADAPPQEEQPSSLPRVALDRPFLWFVMDNVAGLVIAMGRTAQPEE